MIRFLAAALALLAVPAPAQITQPQASTAAATATTYLAGNPLWACDPSQPDGFNPVWYAVQRPDVVSAHYPLLQHYNDYGKREGTPPCQPATVTVDQARASVATLSAYVAQPIVVTTPVAAPIATAAPVPTVAADFARLPAPDVLTPDVYVASGYHIRVGIKLARTIAGKQVPYERSSFVRARVRPDGLGINMFYEVAHLLPSTGSAAEWLLDAPAGYVGDFDLELTDIGNSPNFGIATVHIHVGRPIPAGYAPGIVTAAMDAFVAGQPAPVDPQPPVLVAGPATVDDDLTSLAAWNVGGFALNHMDGYFGTIGAKTLSGKTVDPVPLVTEGGLTFRRFIPQDFRRDPMVIPGGFAGWSMSAITRDLGGAYGYWMIRERLYRYPGEDMSTLWGIAQPGVWPPELDSNETWDQSDKVGMQFLTWHLAPNNYTTGMGSFGTPEGVWIDRLVGRTRRDQEADGIAKYRQWWRLAGDAGPWHLSYQCPDFLEGTAMGSNINNEGMGGDAAGGAAPALADKPFDAVANHAYFDIGRVRYWVPASTAPIAANDNAAPRVMALAS